MKTKHKIQRLILSIVISMIPYIVWGWGCFHWQWWAITIPSIFLMMSIMELIQKPYDQ